MAGQSSASLKYHPPAPNHRENLIVIDHQNMEPPCSTAPKVVATAPRVPMMRALLSQGVGGRYPHGACPPWGSTGGGTWAPNACLHRACRVVRWCGSCGVCLWQCTGACVASACRTVRPFPAPPLRWRAPERPPCTALSASGPASGHHAASAVVRPVNGTGPRQHRHAMGHPRAVARAVAVQCGPGASVWFCPTPRPRAGGRRARRSRA